VTNQIIIFENNCATNDPCHFCKRRTDPLAVRVFTTHLPVMGLFAQ
jgi:hypothetical protein